jgi:nitric oxide reductase subunit B
MGSYFGQDYTAFALKRLTNLAEDNLAQAQFSKNYDALSPELQSGVRDAMRRELQGVNLSQKEVLLPDALAKAISAFRKLHPASSGPTARLGRVN